MPESIEFLSLLNEGNITKLLGLLFVFGFMFGVTEFARNIEKLGE